MCENCKDCKNCKKKVEETAKDKKILIDESSPLLQEVLDESKENDEDLTIVHEES